jgi:hypothetical protein
MHVNRRSFIGGLLTTTVIGPAKAVPGLTPVYRTVPKLVIDIYIKPKVAAQYIVLNTIISKSISDDVFSDECDFCVS